MLTKPWNNVVTKDPARILIVDDEPNIHYSFQKMLQADYRVFSAHNAEEGLSKLKSSRPDLVVMDYKMPGMTGLEALQEIRKIDTRVPVILMTAFGTVNLAIEAMKFGAYEYLLKPFDVNKMRKLIDQALNSSDLMSRVVYVPTDTQAELAKADSIVGSSEAMQEVYKLIGQVAEQDVTVLICGESGTGKELVARAIYHHSKRSERPFLEVNCAALPENLLESELFGHEKGAFTGAAERHIGKFEQVNGGTLFLDEIGEMSLLTQSKILRVIQRGEFTRVGGKGIIKTNVRLICATNRNLEKMISDSHFREDLYYRLNVINIELPPLRERKEDIRELVNYFIAKYANEVGKFIRGIDKAALNLLCEHPWPGNVRQLENCIRRAVVLTKSLSISREDLELDDLALSPDESYETTEEDDYTAIDLVLDRIVNGRSNIKLWPTVERLLIEKALIKTKRNQVRAAKLLGIHRNTLRNRIQKFGL
jgi:nitrogen regulation protein NR(I)